MSRTGRARSSVDLQIIWSYPTVRFDFLVGIDETARGGGSGTNRSGAVEEPVRVDQLVGTP